MFNSKNNHIMSTDKKSQDQINQRLEEKAINIKEKKSDGKEINPQEKQRKEIRQPRDNA